MSRHPLLVFAPDLPAPVLAQLEAHRSTPAWLIDTLRGRILAATAPGAAVFGLVPSDSPAVLDAAMPALSRLRALSACLSSGNDGHTEALVFWTRNRTFRCSCYVAMLSASDGQAVLALVTAAEPRAIDAEEHSTGQITAPLSPSDDAAKLKEIARRIRAGQTHAARSERRRQAHSGSTDRTDAASAAAANDEPPPDAVPVSLKASLAHELKTPLSAIAAAAEIMKDERFGPIGSPQYLGYATDIHGTAQHALSVIGRMLSEARADAEPDTAGLDFIEVDAGKLLQTAVSEVGALADRTGITLKLELPARVPHLIADATSLKQIVLNLVTNAFKFTPDGGEVAVSARHDENGAFTIAVADTGRGMSLDEMKHALGARKGRGGMKMENTAQAGLGIGLPLVRKLAAANGGKLVLESTPGHGTSASVVFRKDRVVPV